MGISKLLSLVSSNLKAKTILRIAQHHNDSMLYFQFVHLFAKLLGRILRVKLPPASCLIGWSEFSSKKSWGS